MVAIFNYGFAVANQNFEKAGTALHTLSDYEQLLQQANDTSYITEQEKRTLQSWRLDPANWNPK